MNRLSILVASLQSRRQSFAPLWAKLKSMESDRVEILRREDNGQLPSGEKRNALLDAATGDYIAFVDDDDDVADCYAEQILAGSLQNPDVITFRVRAAGHQSLRAFGAEGKIWWDGTRSMPANHTCAWRIDIARQSRFGPIGYMDDLYWYWPLHRAGLIKTEIFINRELYIYNFSPKTTQNQTARSKARTKQWTGRTGIGYYRTADGMIWRDIAGCQRYRALREVVNGRGEAKLMSLRELTEFARLRTR